jgi:NitT/TauT family transport system ATP-binding protein
VIRLNDVAFAYGAEPVLRGVSGGIGHGGVLRVAGPNGSGKTTLLKLILGLLTPDAGSIEGVEGVAKAAVFQEDRLIPHLNPLQNVRLALPGKGPGEQALREHFAQAGLAEQALDRPVAELSGGQRRRVAIVRALAGEAPLVTLDEPFTGIDQASLDQVVAYVRRHTAGRDVVLVTHSPAEAAPFPAQVVNLGP